MNNNRNNRRRGRGNRNQGGNGAQLNRIDSRARGNAPQMLDKYKKLAQDAQHNGDRVQMEYYLQFADHYFRVIADNKARQDEQRGSRREEREPAEDYGDDDLDFDRGRRTERVHRPQESDEGENFNVAADVEEGEPGQEGESFLTDERGEDRGESRPRGNRRQQQQRKPRDNRAEGDRPERAEKRAERAERGEKPARGRKPRKSAADADGAGEQRGIDSSILPPSIRGDDAGGDSGALETVE